MNLLIWRHAEAEEGSPDLQRQLTSKGCEQAAAVGTWLDTHLPKTASIFVSPAIRTRQTADALGRFYQTASGLAPGSSCASVLAVLGLSSGAPLDSEESTLVAVGHQPWVGQTLRFLLAGQQRDWSVRKAAVWWLVYRQRDAGEWTLRTVVDPELMKE